MKELGERRNLSRCAAAFRGHGDANALSSYPFDFVSPADRELKRESGDRESQGIRFYVRAI